MDDLPGGPPPPKVGPLQPTASPDAYRRLTPMSLYGSPGTARTPEAAARLSPIPEHAWRAPSGSSALPDQHTSFSSRLYNEPSSACHETHGQYIELIATNTDYPILGEGWAPQSPCDPLLIPTTFSPTCSLPVLSPSYTTLTPSTPHLVASFLGSGHVSGHQPIPSVPEAPSSHLGHYWQLPVSTSSSSAVGTSSQWQTQQSSDPGLQITPAVGPVSPSSIEVWQSLGATQAITTTRRRSTSRSPLNESSKAANSLSPPQHFTNKIIPVSRRSPKHRVRRTSDDSLPVSGIGQQWAKGLGLVGRGDRCSAVAMEEDEAHNNSHESVIDRESVNSSVSEVISVNTKLDEVTASALGQQQEYQVPSGEYNGAAFEIFGACARMTHISAAHVSCRSLQLTYES